MKELLPLHGIVTVLNTPFLEDGSLDIPSLRKNCHYALDSGVAGFLFPAMASEVDKLTEEERIEGIKAVIEEVKGRVPVIGGASAYTQEKRIKYARILTRLGCDGILVSIPYQNDKKYEKAIREIAEAEPGFLMIQDWDFSGYGLPVRLIKRLFLELPAFRSLKIEVVPAGVKYTEVSEETGGKLHLAGGWAVGQMIEGLERGVHAFMPTGMHEIYTAIYQFFHSGDKRQAALLFESILPVTAFSNQHLDISIHFFKRLLFRQGIYKTPVVRPPILPFDHIHEKIAEEKIARVIEITEEVRGK